MLDFADRYRNLHGLATRSGVLSLALRSLRERELESDYRAFAEEYATNPDDLLDSGLEYTLEVIGPAQ